MKKFFLTILLITFLLTPHHTSAAVRSASEPPQAFSTNQRENDKSLKKLYQEIPDLADKEALRQYLEQRLKVAKKANVKPGEISSPNATSIIDLETLNKKQQKTLSAYEKIYEESLKRITDTHAPLNADTKIDGTFYEHIKNTDTPAYVPDFPYVTIKLSDQREIIAPAEEHIPYMLTTIKIEPTGLMNVTEEFIFVSNNDAFPAGFFRILPKYGYTHNGSRRRFDISLQSVTINDKPYPYHITEVGNHLYVEPQKNLNLPTGIYTYRFNYLIDRGIWFYDEFDELSWDITAKTLRNVVGSANALIILPADKDFLAQNAIVSTAQDLFPNRVTITSLGKNVLAFADTEALAVGDDIHLFITLNKGTLLPPSMLQKYLWFIQDYGAVFFALLSLLAIWIAFRISLRQIHLNKDKTRANLKRTPALFRLINSNKLDHRSLLAEMLDLTAKNIISLQKINNTAVAIKKTDNLKKYSTSTKKLVKLLFPATETVLPATPLSLLRLQRAQKYLQRQTLHTYNLYKLKLNSLYILFSAAMLICGIIAASVIAVNPLHTFIVIFICTLFMLPYVWLLSLHFRTKINTFLIKTLAVISIMGIAAWMAIYTSYTYAALIFVSLAVIIFYARAFSKRSGLLRNKIKETEEYKSYLQKNPELAVTAKDFTLRLPYIYAFEIEHKYKNIETLEIITNFNHLLSNHPLKE
ncbi:DUF2207 domain-containing protein [bacterium]|nr:DUF2207 domain-containing protein [bacterium]MBR2273879.1 DUF2207 domain-containing protein [Alphaproteobacteria bacterium]